jgi:hypothetical protein
MTTTHNTWTTPRGVVITEIDHDYDLHAFVVEYNGKSIDIIPADIDDMNECIAELNAGADPVYDGWNDGLGYNVAEVLIHGREIV